MRISDWSSDVCSSDLTSGRLAGCQFEMPLSPATLSAAQLRSVVVEGEPDAQNRPAASAESFGARLQRLRTAKGLTQGQLAVRLGVSEPSISDRKSTRLNSSH